MSRGRRGHENHQSVFLFVYAGIMDWGVGTRRVETRSCLRANRMSFGHDAPALDESTTPNGTAPRRYKIGSL